MEEGSVGDGNGREGRREEDHGHACESWAVRQRNFTLTTEEQTPLLFESLEGSCSLAHINAINTTINAS